MTINICTTNRFALKTLPIAFVGYTLFGLSGAMANNCFEQVTVKGNFAAGIEACSQLISTSENSTDIESASVLAETYNARAIAYGAIGDRDRAIADYSHAVKLNPQMANAYSSRGLLHHDAGNYAQAKSDFDTALRIAPGNLGGFNNMAWMYATAKDDAYRDGTKAVSYAVEAVALLRVPPTLDTMAAAYVEKRHYNEAISIYEEAMEQGGANRVQIYQTDLKHKGYYTGDLNGRYSIATRKALTACVNAGCKMGVN